jgi:hypothetical protein
VISLLASLGQFTSPICLTRALAVSSDLSGGPSWLSGLGPLDPFDSTPIRRDGYLRDSDGSLYWWLSILLPGFRQFRYPAKLFTITSLALAALAGFGWDNVRSGRPRGAMAVTLTLLICASAGLAVVVCFRSIILGSLQHHTSSSLFGPFEPIEAYRTIVASIAQSFVVLALGFAFAWGTRRHPQWMGSAVVILLTADLAVANSRYVITLPQGLFETKPGVIDVIEQAERTDPSPGPFRIYRMWQWYPVSWGEKSSPNRLNEVLAWDRETLYPKFGIDYGLQYTHTSGVGELADYERFFKPFYPRVTDQEAARHLNVELGEEIIYYPRRGFDLWNTRYVIVAFAANGWRDPPRASASFLFYSRQIYPDPERFKGPGGTAEAESWMEDRDFKVIRNLTAYPRSWVVHAARVAKPGGTSTPDPQADIARELLYAADPLWNRSGQPVYDPHAIAWVSRADLAVIRGSLSGMPASPAETVNVTYPSPQTAVLEVNLESPGLVILSDIYYPGWELTVDGKASAIYRVNGSMRGAVVSAGHHRLVYTFRPLSFQIGGAVSIAGLVVLLGLMLACARWPGERLSGDNPSAHSEPSI